MARERCAKQPYFNAYSLDTFSLAQSPILKERLTHPFTSPPDCRAASTAARDPQRAATATDIVCKIQYVPGPSRLAGACAPAITDAWEESVLLQRRVSGPYAGGSKLLEAISYHCTLFLH